MATGNAVGLGALGLALGSALLGAAAACAGPHQDCRESRCCSTPGWRCYEKNQQWAGCRPGCTPGVDPHDHHAHRTPWSCRVLRPGGGGGGGGGRPLPTEAPADLPDAPEGSPVAEHGRLAVSGSRVVDQHGQSIRLRGMSLFWSQWEAEYWNEDVVRWLATDWKVSLVRAAMGVEMGGHLENPDAERRKLRTVVDAAVRAGIYVIIDWHDHHADQHLGDAKAFFANMAQIYGRLPNVLFETFNEPLQHNWWQVVKPYHTELVQVIRRHSDNIVICGTPTWSQDVDIASMDPVPGKNIAYTLHFYAASHGEPLRQKARTAMARGVALFATEWGTCEASGNGALNKGEANAWLAFFEQHQISDANWAVSDKDESCSALRVGADAKGGWTMDQLTESGNFVRNALRAGSGGAAGACSGNHQDCRTSGCCASPGWTCYEKNQHWGMCRPSCTPGVDPDDHPAHRTPWSCRVIQLSAEGPERAAPAPSQRPALRPWLVVLGPVLGLAALTALVALRLRRPQPRAVPEGGFGLLAVEETQEPHRTFERSTALPVDSAA